MQAVKPARDGPPKAPQMYKRYGTLKSECAWWSACQRDSVRVSLSSHAIQNTRSPYATVPWVQLYMHSWHGRVVVDVTQNCGSARVNVPFTLQQEFRIRRSALRSQLSLSVNFIDPWCAFQADMAALSVQPDPVS